LGFLFHAKCSREEVSHLTWLLYIFMICRFDLYQSCSQIDCQSTGDIYNQIGWLHTSLLASMGAQKNWKLSPNFDNEQQGTMWNCVISFLCLTVLSGTVLSQQANDCCTLLLSTFRYVYEFHIRRTHMHRSISVHKVMCKSHLSIVGTVSCLIFVFSFFFLFFFFFFKVQPGSMPNKRGSWLLTTTNMEPDEQLPIENVGWTQ
jgi:hypothetical protein